MDLDFSTMPTTVHIRKELSKTRVGRDIYISQPIISNNGLTGSIKIQIELENLIRKT